MVDGGMSTFWLVVIMLAVILAAYYTTKFLSGKTKRLMKGKFIHVLDRSAFGRDKQVLLIKVGDNHYLIGVTSQSINVIGTLRDEDLNIQNEQTGEETPSGFFGNIRSFVQNAKQADSNLKKARTQYKEENKGTSPSRGKGTSDEDVLEMINRAMERRKRDRMGIKDDGDDA